MRILSIDQSLSSCAMVVFDSDKPIYKSVVRTGSNSAIGKKKKGVVYFDKEVEQMAFICKEILTIVQQFDVEHVVMEGLSFSSIGTATRSLAGLFYCINYTLLLDMFPVNNIHTVTPTEVKSYAREFLPEEERIFISGKKKLKVKMDKKLMMKAVEIAEPGFLGGYNQSNGATDLADSYMIGKLWISKNQ